MIELQSGIDLGWNNQYRRNFAQTSAWTLYFWNKQVGQSLTTSVPSVENKELSPKYIFFVNRINSRNPAVLILLFLYNVYRNQT